MTLLLHIPPREAAPVACDMRTARDTPDERLDESQALFARALVRRERTPDAVVLAFAVAAREQVVDLAQREAACCPFVDYRVELAGDELIWTTTNPRTGDDRAAVDVMLDAFHALADHADDTVGGFFGRLAEQGVQVTEPESARFEFRATDRWHALRVNAAAHELEHHQVAVYLGALVVGALIGLLAPAAASVFEALIYPVLGALLYATFLQVRSPRCAPRSPTAGSCRGARLNFVVVPPIRSPSRGSRRPNGGRLGVRWCC